MTVDVNDIKPGVFVGVLNNVFRGTVPYSVPMIVTKVSPKRITAELACPANRDPETWNSKTRYLDPREIIIVYPDEATARERAIAAYAFYMEHNHKMRELERQATQDILGLLKGEK